jgi:hypothetical protein
MAALANVLSVPPFIILAAGQTIHFLQLPILIGGILAGPAAGFITGAAGGLFMSLAIAKIPFIIGGQAIFGGAAGFLAKRFRPLFTGVISWLVQAPYVAVTDYVWFTLFLTIAPQIALATVTTIMITLTAEAIISSALAEVVVAYLKKAKITL